MGYLSLLSYTVKQLSYQWLAQHLLRASRRPQERLEDLFTALSRKKQVNCKSSNVPGYRLLHFYQQNLNALTVFSNQLWAMKRRSEA